MQKNKTKQELRAKAMNRKQLQIWKTGVQPSEALLEFTLQTTP